MAKFKIQPDPTFGGEVEIPRVGGATVKVPFTFKYLDREQLAKLFSEWDAAMKEVSAPFLAGDTDLLTYSTAVMDEQVKQIKEIVVGWEFEDDFNEENIRALVRTSVSAPAAVIAFYQEAFQKARTGN